MQKHTMFAYDQTVCGSGISVNVLGVQHLYRIHKHLSI